jgi:hypothetical protein
MMSETASQWLLAAMIAFGTSVAVGIGVTTFFYRRLGYPTMPSIVRKIRLRDGIEVIEKKIEPALREGFRVIERNDELLIMERLDDEPSCLMTIEFHRPFGWCPWSTTTVRVKCFKHPWVSWSDSSSSNTWRRTKK